MITNWKGRGEWKKLAYLKKKRRKKRRRKREKEKRMFIYNFQIIHKFGGLSITRQCQHHIRQGGLGNQLVERKPWLTYYRATAERLPIILFWNQYGFIININIINFIKMMPIFAVWLVTSWVLNKNSTCDIFDRTNHIVDVITLNSFEISFEKPALKSIEKFNEKQKLCLHIIFL